MSRVVPVESVRFFSSASALHTARLFEFEGEFYRAVYPQHEAFWRGLFDKGIIDRLIGKKMLVETEISPLRLEGFPMVIKHRRIPFITYATEWPAPALKDAALLQARLNCELAKDGLGSIDAHPFNIVFDGAQPLMVDVGSITPLQDIHQESVVREFDARFLWPLRLMELKQRHIARWVLRDLDSLEASEVGYLLTSKTSVATKIQRRLWRGWRRFQRRSQHQSEGEKSVDVWFDRAEVVESIELGLDRTEWSGYYAEFPPFDDPAKWRPKQHTIANVLERLRPRTLLDIGTNTGWFPQLAATRGIRSVACDLDEGCVDRMYLGVKSRALPVTSLVMNIRDPLGPHGPRLKYAAAMDRLRSECVMALALMHHLVFRKMADFDSVIAMLTQFTSRDLVLEFIAKDDQYVADWLKKTKDPFEWYTLPNLVSRLEKRFQKVEALTSNTPTRTILVCTGLK